jgi:hypothetical protein
VNQNFFFYFCESLHVSSTRSCAAPGCRSLRLDTFVFRSAKWLPYRRRPVWHERFCSRTAAIVSLRARCQDATVAAGRILWTSRRGFTGQRIVPSVFTVTFVRKPYKHHININVGSVLKAVNISWHVLWELLCLGCAIAQTLQFCLFCTSVMLGHLCGGREHLYRVLENRVLRKIFRHNKD